MKTIRCPECNLVNWTTALDCKRCRFVFQSAEVSVFETASVGAHQTAQNQFAVRSFADLDSSPDYAFQADYQPQQNYSNYQPQGNNYAPNNYHQPNYQASFQPTNLKSGLAVASMVLGILSMVLMIILVGYLLAPIGLILGIFALVKASKKPNQYGGKGFAIAGIVTSAIVVLLLPIIMAIAIPNLMAARQAANEGSAISTVRSISQSVEGGKIEGKLQTACWNLNTLVRNKSVNEGLADGEHNGYRFSITDLPSGGCEVNATPISNSHGTRSFYYLTAERKIHGANKNGATADKNDPVID